MNQPDVDKIINELLTYNIIYLDRNDIDIFISKKLAEKNSYSNEVYKKNLEMDDFNFDTFRLFLNQKHNFLSTYLSLFHKIKYIHYNFIKEKDHKHNIDYMNQCLNSFYSTNIEYLVYEPYYKYYDIFNKKQNKFKPFALNIADQFEWIHKEYLSV